MLTDIYNVLRSPQNAFARIADEGNLSKALIIQAVILFLSGLVSSIGSGAETTKMVTDALVTVGVSIFICFIMAGMSHGIAGFMNGEGTWKKQFIVFGYCMLPQLVIIPLQIIALCMGMAEMNAAVIFITSVWCLILNVFSIDAVQKIGLLKSCISLLVPYVAVSGITAGIAVRALM